MQRFRKAHILLWIPVLLGMACLSTGKQAPAENTNQLENTSTEMMEDTGMPGAYPGLSGTDFGSLLMGGKLQLNGVSANSSDEDTYGQILSMSLTNLSTGEIIVTLPCGLVFVPDDDENQRLMMVQESSIVLGPGETKTPTPFVVCIDVAAGAPSFSDSYQPEYMVNDLKMAQLAECVCQKELDLSLGSLDGVGVQFAAWAIDMGGDFSQTLDENPEMTAYFEGEYGDSLEAAVAEMMQMVSMFGDSWLQDCGIDPSN